MEDSAISWTDHTFNCWWGCEHASRDDPDGIDADPAAISEECRSCYAETFDHRLGGRHWGPGAEPRWFGADYWAKPLAWNARAEKRGGRERVFVSSMADWAQRHRDPEINAKMDAVRARLWAMIRACPWLDFLLLTKRAERLRELLPWHSWPDEIASGGAPWPNVWVGVTAGTRRSLWRVHRLRQVRAAVRFISAEPLLEHVPADAWDRALRWSFECPECGDGVKADEDGCCAACGADCQQNDGIDWLIVGDESGPRRRPAQLDWVRTAREAALRHGVAFHLKQLHVSGKKVHLPVLDGRTHPAIPR